MSRATIWPDTLVVVGNGLNMDLRHSHPRKLAQWDTRNPLSWDVKAPGSAAQLIDLLPQAKTAVAEARSRIRPTRNDFQVFAEALLIDRERRPELRNLLTELTHYLTLAFSTYQLEIARRLVSQTWKWGEFFYRLRPRLVGAISLNYDLVFEAILELDRFELIHLALNNVRDDQLAIFKPHGSIDYIPEARWISMGPHAYPLTYSWNNVDIPVERLPFDQLLTPRLHSDIVLPTEASRMRAVQWVAPGWEWVREIGQRTKVLLIMGVSYWDVDQPELDLIISSVDERATAIVANPVPSDGLLETLHRRFKNRVQVWKKGPPIP